MSLIKKFASVGGATMASRVLGFVREALIAGLLGAGPVADAFYAAFRFPNLFRRLFAEGAFNSAFIPLFARELEEGGARKAEDFTKQILSVLIFVLLLLSALAMIFMPFLTGTIIAPKFSENPEKFELTVLLTRIMFPYLAAMSLVAMLSGILNSYRKYFLAAFVPVLLNVIFIAVLLGGWQMGFTDRELGIAMAIGVLVSGVVQFAILVAGVRKQGFHLKVGFPKLSPSVKRLLVLALPTAIAGGITQINLLIGQIIASGQAGAIAIMNYADRLMQLPLGIIGISIGVVLLPELTRALAGENKQEVQRLQNRSLEFGLGLTIPAAVGLFMIPLPLVSLIYERGAFDRETAQITAQVLAAFAVGLPSFVLIKIFQPSFYAREDMKTPMWFSGINAVVNVVLAIILFPIYGVVGLAAATSIAGFTNALLLAIALFSKEHLTVSGGTIKNIILICVASLLMAAVLYLGNWYMANQLLDSGLLLRILLVGTLVGVSAATYFLIVLATGALPRDQLMRLLKRK